jgi:hypothetical protein
MTTTGYCIDELQRLHRVTAKKVDNTWVIEEGELKGVSISDDFLYANEDAAHLEIADRHIRLNKAFKSFDLVGCLSINKEPARKMEGHSLKSLEALAAQDKKDYKNWIKKLEKSWEEINHERPDLEKLAKTLRNANLIQNALQNPLAIDFIEIMSREAQLQKLNQKQKDSSPEM